MNITTMNIRLLVLVSLFLSSLLIAEPPEKVSRIKIYIPDRTSLEQVWSSGIDYCGMSGKVGDWMEFVAGRFEREKLTEMGVGFEVVIDDMAKFEESRLTKEPVNALGFGYGSMGGYYTYAEVGRQLDTMKLQYPSLITTKASMGTTIEGRSMWFVKISDNPDTEEGEPEVLYTALHHAREPEGMMTVMYYMWWLLQNYGTNDEATYLVNNRQMYFIPVMNADGYVYNQTTNPSGGGMWRKNRKNNGDGTYGVDPNRNYGPYYMWNASNGGSSTTTSSETYRGTAPFSEPENAAIDVFMRAHNFKTVFNYHTYGNYLIYPYGYTSSENSDSLIYREWAYDMTADNHYTNGTDQQTVNYSTRGNSDDYMFGDTSLGKARTFAMTPEVGTSGFWPSTGEIFPLAQQNLRQNKELSYLAGSYSSLKNYSVIDEGGNGFFDRGEAFSLLLNIKNKGLKTAQGLNVNIAASDASVQFLSSTIVVDSIPKQVTTPVTFTGNVIGTAVTGVPFWLYITQTDGDGFLKRDTIKMFLGTPATLLADSASSGTGNWTTGSGWGVTTTSHSAPNAFTDSPSGNYLANANNSLTLNSQINLVSYQYSQLKFWTKWAIEPSWDFATVEISTNNGSSWATLKTKLSHSGSGRATSQPTTAWGFESYTPGLTWVEQDADLSSYSGSQIKIRFRVAADGGEQRDGFYVDDIRLFGWNPNYDTAAASTPALNYPPNDSLNIPRRPTLRWYSSSAALSYRLQVASDVDFTSNVFDDSTLTDTVKMLQPLNYNTQYWWRVWAKNNVGASDFTDAWTFTTIVAPPALPTLVFPANAQQLLPLTTTLTWNTASGAASYIIQLASDTNFTSLLIDDSTLTDTSKEVSGLNLDSKYFWRVKAVNIGGTSMFSEIRSFSTLGTPPAATLLVEPENGSTYLPSTLQFEWNSAVDATRYHLQIATDSLFTSIVFDDTTITQTSTIVGPLGDEVTYFWRVRSLNDFGASEWTSGWNFTTGTKTILVSVNHRWNLLSVPLAVPDYRKSTLFGSSTSSAFAFEGAYVEKETLANGVGYWMKFNGAQNVGVVGNTHQYQSIPVSEGWNLVGSISDPLSVNMITSNPGGIVTSEFYEYTSGYSITNTIQPGKGYWVKVNQAGTLILSSLVNSYLSLGKIKIVAMNELPPPPPEGDGNTPETRNHKPETFSLEQNYPNPFNPTTVISFQLPVSGYVTLKIYNMLGEEVSSVVEGNVEAGYKSVEWDASNLSSGVYTYRLVTGEFHSSKTMMLMK
ncbi:MAG: immune inhibitor A [Ignavibacteriae bacterium]|nr:immune inhibitor A [Ignavibacteriota bacterium]